MTKRGIERQLAVLAVKLSLMLHKKDYQLGVGHSVRLTMIRPDQKEIDIVQVPITNGDVLNAHNETEHA